MQLYIINYKKHSDPVGYIEKWFGNFKTQGGAPEPWARQFQ
jgi:hypothetical protein